VTLADFLLARIAEDEAKVEYMRQEEARALGTSPLFDSLQMNALGGIDIFISPDRWAAECEAKRRIAEQCQEWLSYDGADWEWTDRGSDLALAQIAAPRMLKLLALPYADHPDYRDEWKP
jgi:hypothetical protein